MTASSEGELDPQAPARSAVPHRTRWWLGVAAFVGGVLVGILIVGLLNVTTPDFLTQWPGEAAPTAPAGGSDADPVPVTAQARVNAACLRVINEAQDVAAVLSGVDDAVTDVDLQQLDDIVRRLQPLQPRLEQDLQACRVDTSIGTDPGTGGPMTPAVPQPSSSATR
jgi:hypothetical protein